MIRKLKVLGIALIASFAMSAVSASGASANPFFHSEFAGIFLTGAQGEMNPNVLTTDLGELKCKVVQYGGSQGAMTTPTMTLTPKYEECTINNQNAVVTVNGCAYTLHLEQQTNPIEALMGIECPDGQKIVIHAPQCTITVPPQGPHSSVTFTNEGAGMTRSFIADLNVSGIDYQEHGAGCAGAGTTENGTYTGQATITGEAGGNHVGIWVQ